MQITKICLLFSLIMAASLLKANDKSGFSYPELLVTPSASSRLLDLAKTENTRAFSEQATTLTGAGLTTVLGLMTMGQTRKDETDPDRKDLPKYAGLGAALVGASWLGISMYQSFGYRPLGRSWVKVKKMEKGTQRQRLSRERYAEEALMERAHLDRRLAWLSAISMSLAAAFVIDATTETDTKVYGGITLATAWLPFIFPSTAWKAYKQHSEYKKKIYGPITGIALLPSSGGRKVRPALSVELQF